MTDFSALRQQTSKSYTAGHFELQIDGHKTTTFLKSVDGGSVKANTVDDPIGANSGRVKHVATVDVEPMSIEFGMAGSAQVLQWIQGSWNRQWSRRNGQITHADFNLKQTFEHWFYDALITETTFPTLDGSSKDGGYLKCKIQPEQVVTKTLPPSSSVSSEYTTKQKMWMPSAFRFTLDQIDDLQYANKIDSFTIKQGVKKMYTGADRFPQIEPTKIEFPNITGTIALGYADKLLQWHHDYIVAGKKDPKAQMSGGIEFLSPDRKSTIFRINLFEVGLVSASIQQATANQDQIKRVKFEMFVGSMTLDGTGALGLE
ncbi:MAG TPA: phage tail protein [Kofleriaceae bacterium]|nr:phage tail protein [Kofleriaceae bacterium]